MATDNQTDNQTYRPEKPTVVIMNCTNDHCPLNSYTMGKEKKTGRCYATMKDWERCLRWLP